ncbi:hypothetical protein P4S64_23975 [Vibrio sp. M60_M31a]
MSAFSKKNIGKLMATVFAEYKDSGRKTPEGKVILTKRTKKSSTRRRFSLRLAVTSVLPVSTRRQKLTTLRYCCVQVL